MKVRTSGLKFLLLICVVIISASAQVNPHPATGLIPSDRCIDWSHAGIPGGIPVYPVAVNVKSDPYNAKGNGLIDDSDALIAAINDCPAGYAVLIPTGTYKITKTFNINKGIVIRGEGPTKTKIIQYTDNTIFSISGPSTSYYWGQTHPEAMTNINLVSGYLKGSDTVVIADASLIVIGDLLLFDQLNDSTLASSNGVGGPCTWCGLGIDAGGNMDGSRSYGELALVKVKNGNTIILDHPLYYNFQSQYQPRVVRITGGNTLRGAGVEDLFITWNPGVTDGAGVYFTNCAHCWAKNVESYLTTYKHIELSYAYGCEVRDSYIHGVVEGYLVGNRGYGFGIDGCSTANLIENNIFYDLHTSVMIGSSGGAGNVVGYNFMEKTTHYQPNWWLGNSGTHGAHTYINLWEGNVLNKIAHDNYWGSGSHHTWFRNYVNAQTICHQELSTVNVEAWNYYSVFLGNVLRAVGGNGVVEQIPLQSFQDNPVIWRVGFTDGSATTGIPGDMKVAQTMIKHGNWEEPANAIQWDTAISQHTLPASLYLPSKPNWFGDVPWPPIGPDVTGLTNKIPAQLRFDTTSDTPLSDWQPTKYILLQNYPNPFNYSTTIIFGLSATSNVTLKIYDVLGREIANHTLGRYTPGYYDYKWNAAGMSSGVYFYRLSAGSYTETKKLILMK